MPGSLPGRPVAAAGGRRGRAGRLQHRPLVGREPQGVGQERHRLPPGGAAEAPLQVADGPGADGGPLGQRSWVRPAASRWRRSSAPNEGASAPHQQPPSPLLARVTRRAVAGSPVPTVESNRTPFRGPTVWCVLPGERRLGLRPRPRRPRKDPPPWTPQEHSTPSRCTPRSCGTRWSAPRRHGRAAARAPGAALRHGVAQALRAVAARLDPPPPAPRRRDLRLAVAPGRDRVSGRRRRAPGGGAARRTRGRPAAAVTAVTEDRRWRGTGRTARGAAGGGAPGAARAGAARARRGQAVGAPCAAPARPGARRPSPWRRRSWPGRAWPAPRRGQPGRRGPGAVRRRQRGRHRRAARRRHRPPAGAAPAGRPAAVAARPRARRQPPRAVGVAGARPGR